MRSDEVYSLYILCRAGGKFDDTLDVNRGRSLLTRRTSSISVDELCSEFPLNVLVCRSDLALRLLTRQKGTSG